MAAALKCKTSAEENAKVKDIDHRNLIIPFYPHSHIVSLAMPVCFGVSTCAHIYFDHGCCCVVSCCIIDNIKCS